MRTQVSYLPAPRAMEHRWGERLQLDSPARLLLQDGRNIEARVRNASISGALIETGTPLPPYTMLSVMLMCGQGYRRRTIELPACVVRIARGCIGVEWRDMAVPTLVALLREAGTPTGA